MKKIIIITLIVGSIVLTTGFLMHKDSSSWVKVEYQKVKESFTVSGNVETLKKSLYKAPLKGKILKVYFEEGDMVKKGQLLAEYEKDNYKAQLDQLKADLYQSEQNYNKMIAGNRIQTINTAKAHYENQKMLLQQKLLEYEKIENDKERNTALFNKKMFTPQEYEHYIKNLEITKTMYENQKHNVDAAFNEYSLAKEGYRKEDILAAKGNVEAVKAQIKDLEATYEKTDILAPISGKITEKDIEPEDNVLPGKLLFKLFSKTDLEVKALIEEEDIANVKMNDLIDISLDAFPNAKITGHVSSIYDKVEESTRLLPVKVTIDKEGNNIDILPGMTASCTFGGHEIEYLTVPRNALNKDGKKFYVETKNGKVFLEVGKEFKNKVLVKGKLSSEDEVLTK